MIYGIVWLTGLGGFPNPAFVEEIASRVNFDVPTGQLIFIYILIAATLNLVTSSLPALGEEIGWRGLLVPELYKVTDFTTTSLISGGIWAVWHYPGILFTDYRSEAPVWYAMLCFTVMAIAFSFIMAWMRLKSGSVWTATLLHAAHNVVIQTILTPLTVDTGPTEYIIDEFGVGIAMVYVIVALIFWRMRDQLPAPSAEQAP
jgi:membrane protease YdiL (CAAX protease family)